MHNFLSLDLSLGYVGRDESGSPTRETEFI
jgi:hypothetical protein